MDDNGQALRSRSLLTVTFAGAAVSLALAWPVVLAPGERIIGTGIAGRHHDPFTVMWQFEHGPPPPPYRQPLVDDVGAALADVAGPVRAFNAIVFVTFPLSVLTAYVLARYMRMSPAGAATAAFAFAFAPPHLAHAAYHPHIAQTQWIPLYFLALWACVDRGSVARVTLLALAVAALTLSNLYAAFIAAVVTPVALVAATIGRSEPGRRRLAIVFSVLAVIGLGVVIAVRSAAPELFSESGRFAFDRADLAQFGAQWRAYVLPPVEHPLWGARSAGVWTQAGVSSASGAVLEQQMSISWALLVLAAVAIVQWIRSGRNAGGPARAGALAAVPMLVLVGVWAALCSLAPVQGSWNISRFAPATWLYPLAPMFRSYARFGFVTHLCVALLAGLGVMRLLPRGGLDRRPGTAKTQAVIAGALLVIAAIEYWPLPARSRDVLPTSAHRWLATEPLPMRVLDCVPSSPAETLVPRFMERDLSTLSPSVPTCYEPNLTQQLATLGYTHLIARGSGVDALRPPIDGLPLIRAFDDAAVYAVTAEPGPVTLVDTTGFSPTEHDVVWAWRWMGQEGTWVLHRAGGGTASVSLDIDIEAFNLPRRVSIAMDGGAASVIVVGTTTARYRLGPWVLGPGTHHLTFTALEPAHAAPLPDTRMLTVVVRNWRWEDERR
jgi:hypothetical protein